ncbi:MAG: RNA pseudouridine synthase [Micavibrio sp.]|nr:RNA pseudouridine synthase [Micavibrio sp.]|tara:strand:+ start:1573 stop:2280 length:708 start_codon:yes stop_codon:yes gene_type:complete
MYTRPTKPKAFSYAPPSEPLKILHEDDALLVFSKPSGLLSVPGRAEDHADCLQARAAALYPESLLVHRLDLETSGIFIMARTKEAQSHLGKQFERRKTAKTYIARIWGDVEGEEGLIDLPLRCDWENRPMQMVCYEHGRPSQTHWTVLARETLPDGSPVTRLELNPITGRSHQLRVHLLELGNKEQGGHPILGDDFYAHERAHKAAPRLQLHAEKLTIHHPNGGERISFIDPCPF